MHWLDARGGMEAKGAAVGGIQEFMSPRFLYKFHKANGGTQAKGDPIQCVPMGDILDMLGMRHINYWSLDVEGAELEIVKSLDWSKFKVDVMSVEADNFNTTKNQLVRQHLESSGMKFDHHTDSGNEDWFVGPNFVPSTMPGYQVQV